MGILLKFHARSPKEAARLSHTVTKSSNHAASVAKNPVEAFNHGMKAQIAKLMQAAQKEEAMRLDMAQKALKLTNQELADKLGIEQSAWSQYRTGRRPIPKEALYMLQRDYGITVAYLMFDDRSRVPADLFAFLRKNAA